MTSPVTAAAVLLEAAVAVMSEVRVTRRVGQQLSPPMVVVGVPELRWAGYCRDGQPREATFPLLLVVPLDEHAGERLAELVPRVADAVTERTPGEVTTAIPVTYEGLPAYRITVEINLE